MENSKFPQKYDFLRVEKDKYAQWLEQGFFTPNEPNKKSFTIVIPPPNITGKLHLGHVLDTSLQDIIVRRKRMMGYNTLFLPGMDHASIATQAKVEEELRQKKISRYDLGREKFIEVAWQWKEKYASLIREQWATIGLSLDYTRERFTLDKSLNHAVNTVFVKMYNDGLIYRGQKIINWDVHSQTALSNIEVEYKEIEGAFYHIKYPFVDSSGSLEIVTTRPETMFADVALMVHPEDDRYLKYIGKKVYIPLTNKAIPIISDTYVDRTFGTGVVKVTPAHDPNDYEVSLRHNLDKPLCMNEDGTMNELAFNYQNMERFACRKAVIRDLENNGLLVKKRKIIHAVGHSERTGVIVEPRLSKQWFVKMQPLADLVIEMQKTEDKINFIPNRFEKTLLSWLTNIQDWCISRQLWWGHRIPAWYRDDEVYVGINPPQDDGWKQDEDALDTWFSSALWPFSTLGWPENSEDFKRFFPTDTLVTAYDIIFFWVARMAIQAKYLTGRRPFKDVLIHGLIRDEMGRKVSKSLGNGVDIMDAVNKYGMDSLRYFLTTANSPGQDIRYSNEKMEASWNYINKLWNIARFININLTNEGYQNQEINPSLLNNIDKWILKRLNQVIEKVNFAYENYKFIDVAKILYHFVWDEFAAWYLEMTKVIFSSDDKLARINTCSVLSYCLAAILKMLHPFMPFVTEELYMNFFTTSIVKAKWPEHNKAYEFRVIKNTKMLFDLIVAVRNLRATNNISQKQAINLYLYCLNNGTIKILNQYIHYIKRFANTQNLFIYHKQQDIGPSLITVIDKITIMIPIEKNLSDVKEKLLKEKDKMLSEINRCKVLLENHRFLEKAPQTKINEEKEKLTQYQVRLNEIEQLLSE